MRRLWKEDNVTHEGAFFSCHNVSITPKSFLEPSTLVWIGGRSHAAARRVERVGDGWLVSSVTPEEIREGREIVFSTVAEHGRETEDDQMGVLLVYYIASGTEAAASTAQKYITRNRPDAHFTEYSALGSTEQVALAIRGYFRPAPRSSLCGLCARLWRPGSKWRSWGKKFCPNSISSLTASGAGPLRGDLRCGKKESGPWAGLGCARFQFE